jgi:arylsulfatase A-like enzyme
VPEEISGLPDIIPERLESGPMSGGRPNIVLFMPDQLRADCVGCFGNPIVRTPNIDALAARGTRFANAYANHPVCGPSRVNLMTGWYPHTRGHRTLTHLLKPWEPNLLRYLKGAGYNVAWVGQRGDVFAPGVTEESTNFCGWTVRPEHVWTKPRHPEGSKLYGAFYNGRRDADGVVLDFDEAAVRTAETWLADGPREPWVLFVALIFPHLPFEVEDPWYSLHQPADVPAPIAPERCTGKADFQQAIRDAYGLTRLEPDDWAEVIRTYYGMISRVDAQLGRVLEAVARTGAESRTATFFFTDHGEYAGDYGLVEKWPSGLERCLLQNPLIAALPDGAEGQASEAFVEMVDLLPTLLELGETEPEHTHFGRSFAGVLKDARVSHREQAFSEGGFSVGGSQLNEPIVPGPYRAKTELQRDRPELAGKAVALRTARHTYVYRLYESDELYDRERDPDETTNLIGGAEADAIAAGLRERVLAWLLETSDVIPWQKDPRFPKVPDGYHDPV